MPHETVYLEDLNRLHAALAIQHECDVADIRRELQGKTSNKDNDCGVTKHRAVYTLLNNNEAESSVICQVRVILPKYLDDQLQKIHDTNGGLISAVQKYCPVVYDRFSGETVNLRDIKEARYHYNNMKRGTPGAYASTLIRVDNSATDFGHLCAMVFALVILAAIYITRS